MIQDDSTSILTRQKRDEKCEFKMFAFHFCCFLQAFISMVVNDDDNLATEFGFTPPSATLKALSLNAANQIMYPTTLKAFEFESSTNAYGGMATNVPLG